MEAKKRAEKGQHNVGIERCDDRILGGRCVFGSVWVSLDGVEGLFKVFGDTAQLMSPLVVKSLIRFSQEGASITGIGNDDG